MDHQFNNSMRRSNFGHLYTENDSHWRFARTCPGFFAERSWYQRPGAALYVGIALGLAIVVALVLL